TRGVGEFGFSLFVGAVFSAWLLANPAGLLDVGLRTVGQLSGAVVSLAADQPPPGSCYPQDFNGPIPPGGYRCPAGTPCPAGPVHGTPRRRAPPPRRRPPRPRPPDPGGRHRHLRPTAGRRAHRTDAVRGGRRDAARRRPSGAVALGGRLPPRPHHHPGHVGLP